MTGVRGLIWVCGVGVCAALNGCGGGSAPSSGASKAGAAGSAAAGSHSGGSSGEGDPSGSSTGLVGGDEGVSGGGAGGAGEPPVLGELYTTIDCDVLRYVDVVADDRLFFTCIEPVGGEFSSKTEFVLRSSTMGAEPTVVARSAQPLEGVTSDEAADYAYEFGDFDATGNTWRGNIRRIVKGSSTLTPFVNYSDPNNRPYLVLQTESALVIGQGYVSGNKNRTSLVAYSPADGKQVSLGPTMDGYPAAQWVEGGNMVWVNEVPGDTGGLYSVPLTGGTPTKLADVPDLCLVFVYNAEKGLAALCGKGAPYDIVHMSLMGETTPWAKGVTAGVYDYFGFSDRLYWGNSDAGITAMGDAAETASVQLPAKASILTLTDHYLFFQQKQASGVAIRRLALADIH